MTRQADVAQALAPHAEAGLVEPLSRYGAFVLEANDRFNLTGAKTAADVAEHIIDSLTVVPIIVGPLLDIGSGAGFPAVPVAIATGVAVTMVESTAKKAAFLRSVVEALGLPAAVVTARAEAAAHDPALRERFRSATARAVSRASTVAELLLPFLEPGGVAVLQRGSLEEREREALADAALMLGGALEDERLLSGERRLLIVRKLSATPHRFPRRVGIPEKRPLCT